MLERAGIFPSYDSIPKNKFLTTRILGNSIFRSWSHRPSPSCCQGDLLLSPHPIMDLGSYPIQQQDSLAKEHMSQDISVPRNTTSHQ